MIAHTGFGSYWGTVLDGVIDLLADEPLVLLGAVLAVGAVLGSISIRGVSIGPAGSALRRPRRIGDRRPAGDPLDRRPGGVGVVHLLRRPCCRTAAVEVPPAQPARARPRRLAARHARARRRTGRRTVRPRPRRDRRPLRGEPHQHTRARRGPIGARPDRPRPGRRRVRTRLPVRCDRDADRGDRRRAVRARSTGRWWRDAPAEHHGAGRRRAAADSRRVAATPRQRRSVCHGSSATTPSSCPPGRTASSPATSSPSPAQPS